MNPSLDHLDDDLKQEHGITPETSWVNVTSCVFTIQLSRDIQRLTKAINDMPEILHDMTFYTQHENERP